MLRYTLRRYDSFAIRLCYHASAAFAPSAMMLCLRHAADVALARHAAIDAAAMPLDVFDAYV